MPARHFLIAIGLSVTILHTLDLHAAEPKAARAATSSLAPTIRERIEAELPNLEALYTELHRQPDWPRS
jgi:hypothetical protein